MNATTNKKLNTRITHALYQIVGTVSTHSISPNTHTDPMIIQIGLKMIRGMAIIVTIFLSQFNASCPVQF